MESAVDAMQDVAPSSLTKCVDTQANTNCVCIHGEMFGLLVNIQRISFHLDKLSFYRKRVI